MSQICVVLAVSPRLITTPYIAPSSRALPTVSATVAGHGVLLAPLPRQQLNPRWSR
jgi:hypothetical protein